MRTSISSIAAIGRKVSTSVKDTHPSMVYRKHKITVIGSGNWGTTMAKLVAENTREHPDIFEETVQMWVYEEMVTLSKNTPHDSDSDQPRKLSEVINKLHENIKYLPNITLPTNVVANPDPVAACKDSTMLIFVLPHQFVDKACNDLRGKILPYARAISCIKGVDVSESGIELMSEKISKSLNIYCGALSGANIASEIAQEKFSATTVAYHVPYVDSLYPMAAPEASNAVTFDPLDVDSQVFGPRQVLLTPVPAEYVPFTDKNLRNLFQRPYFHVRVVNDVVGVSLGGALKNIIALAAGYVDGLGWGDNAKAEVIRVGIQEMVRFGVTYYGKNTQASTFTEESCGVADVFTSCMGGRNFRCAKMATERGETIQEIERTELNGQKLQGTSTTEEVHKFLQKNDSVSAYPLFGAVYSILEGKARAEEIPDLIRVE